MAKEITQHGIRWINNDCGLYCSECNSGNVIWEIDYNHPKYCDTRTWIAKCTCNVCGCKWTLTREETVRDEC
jgi:hypothetical protein